MVKLPREWHSLFFSERLGKVVLFGGLAGRTTYNDLLQLGLGAWLPIRTNRPLQPRARWGGAVTYDVKRKRMILFGGRVAITGTNDQIGDMWQLTLPRSMFSLVVDTDAVSLSRGGTVKFNLQTPAAHTGKVYVILGSMGGTSPGLKLGKLTLPLNPFDAYFGYTLGNPNGLITPSIGFLVGAKAQATLTIPKGSPASLQGRVLHHAFVAFPYSPISFDFVSNAVSLKLVK